MNKYIIALLFGLVAYLTVPSHVFAQERSEVNYSEIEALGLYDEGDDQKFLGAGIYHRSDRSSLTFLLKKVTQSSWPALNIAINNLLLASADTSTLNNDIPVELGQDLLTLRLNTLLKRGLNKQAFDLYSKLPGQSLNEITSRLGIFAMLFNQEKAKACLDVKILFPEHSNISLWQELNAYCLLRDANRPEFKSPILQSLSDSENFIFAYDIATFESLNFFERSILTAEDAIALPRQENAYTDIPAQHISALLQQSNLSLTQRILLTAQSIGYGLNEPSALELLLEKAQLNAADVSSDLARLGDINKNLNKLLASKKSDQINEAYEIARQHNIFLLSPLLPIIDKMDAGEDISLKTIQNIIPLYFTINRPIPSGWIKDLNGLSCGDKSCETLRLKLLTLFLIMDGSLSDDLRETSKNEVQTYLLSSTKLRSWKNIIENIDSGTGNGDKVRIIYENDFDLINNPRYTMPPYIAVKELARLGQNQNTATTLLLSGVLLAQIEPKNIYSGTLSDIVTALRDTGLTELSRDILAQAFLEINNEGE